jgi:AcrR family transcriptional regulator
MPSRVVSPTAERIASAALGLFAVHGYAGMVMEQVRREAGVSNGSLYHHFGSRAELVARLFEDGMGQCRRGVLEVLQESTDAEAGVRAVVATTLSWVQENTELARLLYSDLPDEVLLCAEPDLSKHNRDYVDVVAGWVDKQTARGRLIERPFSITHALWLGPAQEFVRHWLGGRSPLTPTQAATDLGEGAWRALAAR